MKKIWNILRRLGLLTLLTGCSGFDLLNASIPTSGYRTVKNIAYGEEDRNRLDIYLPEQAAPGHPVVVFFYGGSWQSGSKDDYVFAGQALASKGIVAVIPDYRLYPAVSYPVFMQDAAAAFVWTHNHIAAYGGDPGNVFAAGHSAGAYNAVMLSVNAAYIEAAGGSRRWIKGTIGLAGPYDFLPLTDPQLIAMFGGAELPATQPITYVGPNCPPMLLATGDKDEEVYPRNSIRLAARLEAEGDQAEVKIYPGQGHIGIALALADGFRGRAPVLDDMAAFINAHTAAQE